MTQGDLELAFDAETGEFDLVLDRGDLRRDRGLRSAVVASLFSDARSDEGERGWWPDTSEDRHGSLLWTLGRAKQTNETAARAEEFARDALAWMVDRGIAERVEVTATFIERGHLSLRVQIHRASSLEWSHLWEGVEDYEVGAGTVLLQLKAVA